MTHDTPLGVAAGLIAWVGTSSLAALAWSRIARRMKPQPRECAVCHGTACLFKSEMFRCLICVHCHDRLVDCIEFEEEFK